MGGTGNRVVTLTALAGTLNQYAGKYMVCYYGDQAGTKSKIVSNTNATPTVLTVADDQGATLAGDLIAIQTTGIVFKHIKEGSKADIGERGGVIHTPEIRGQNFLEIEKLYKVQVYETTEANLCDTINNILVGCKKLWQHETITGYTKPSSLINITMATGGNQARYYDSQNDATQDILLLVKWVIS